MTAEYLRGVLNALHEQGCPLDTLVVGIVGENLYYEVLDPIDVDVDAEGDGSFSFNVP